MRLPNHLSRISLYILALTLPGCVERQTLVIPPATMALVPSPLNHPEGPAYVLVENATLSSRVKFRSVHRWALKVTVHGEAATNGTWPQLRIELDEARTRTVTVDNRAAIPYWFNFVAEPGFADLKLSLVNGRASSDGPTLMIERVEIVPL